jgi:hypothetical protein
LPDIDDGSPEKMVLLNFTGSGHAYPLGLRRSITMASAQRQSVTEVRLAASGVRTVATFVLMVTVSPALVSTALLMVVGFAGVVIAVVLMALISAAIVDGASLLSGMAKLP